jgi:hypothetical protein
MSVAAEKSLTIDQQKRLDTILNKTFLDLAVYSLAGYGVGLGTEYLFLNKNQPSEALLQELAEVMDLPSTRLTLTTFNDLFSLIYFIL